MSYEDRLKQYDDNFNGAQRQRDLGELPPPGDYQAIVDRFDFFEAKSNGRLYLKTELKVVGTEHEGWPIETIHDLEDPERFDWLKTHLHRLGADVDNFQLSQIETLLHDLLDVPVEVNVYEYESKKDGSTQLGARVNRRLGDPMRQEVPADAEGLKDQQQQAKRVGGGGGGANSQDEKIPF